MSFRGPDSSRCGCGAHQQHRLFAYLHEHPSATMPEAARDLHLTYASTRQIASRLKHRPNLHRVCPLCFETQVSQGVCQSCGFEPDAPDVEVGPTSAPTAPTNNLLPGRGLGWVTTLTGIGLVNGPKIINKELKRATEDPKIRACEEDVLAWLEPFHPPEEVLGRAGRLVVKERWELETKYPRLASSTNARKQVDGNVITRLKLLYPSLMKRSQQETSDSESDGATSQG